MKHDLVGTIVGLEVGHDGLLSQICLELLPHINRQLLPHFNNRAAAAEKLDGITKVRHKVY